jgi:hypothetical protein
MISLESIEAFSSELRKEALLGTLATLPLRHYLAQKALARTETPRKEKLRRELSKADPTEVKVRAKPPHFDTDRSGKPFISVRKKEDPAIMAHELGHAEIHADPVGRVIQSWPSRALPAIGTTVAMIDLQKGGEATIGKALLLAITTLPVVGYEGAASLKGLRKLEEAGATKEELAEARDKLLRAWGTYASLPVELVGNYATVAGLRHLTGRV